MVEMTLIHYGSEYPIEDEQDIEMVLELSRFNLIVEKKND